MNRRNIPRNFKKMVISRNFTRKERAASNTHLRKRLPVGGLRGLRDLGRDEAMVGRTDGVGHSWVKVANQRGQLSASVTGTTVGTQGVIAAALFQSLGKEKDVQELTSILLFIFRCHLISSHKIQG